MNNGVKFIALCALLVALSVHRSPAVTQPTIDFSKDYQEAIDNLERVVLALPDDEEVDPEILTAIQELQSWLQQQT